MVVVVRPPTPDMQSLFCIALGISARRIGAKSCRSRPSHCTRSCVSCAQSYLHWGTIISGQYCCDCRYARQRSANQINASCVKSLIRQDSRRNLRLQPLRARRPRQYFGYCCVIAPVPWLIGFGYLYHQPFTPEVATAGPDHAPSASPHCAG